MIHGVENFKKETVNLIAGSHGVIEIPITIASGSNIVTEGTILGRVTATNKYKPLNALATTGEEIPRVILKHTIDATTTDINTIAYTHGEFNKSAIPNYSIEAKLKLMEFGIYIKEVR